ncbi:MAG: AAA family ATPase, partial [Desulfovibrionaceae bacterium]|nr:AAA family ATPase [Desulfovibrionaceae bacterium]
MFGFTEDELKELIAETIDPACCRQSREEIFQRMKELYDGYSFSRRSEEHVFNPSMSLYYLNALVKNNAEPEELMDPS